MASKSVSLVTYHCALLTVLNVFVYKYYCNDWMPQACMPDVCWAVLEYCK